MIVLKLLINVTDAREVKSTGKTVRMLAFDGSCEGDFFIGIIEPGAIDTQIINNDGSMTLSARYMLNGIDNAGTPCRLFIENNMVAGEPTYPKITTDSKQLRWLETADLRGKMLHENERFFVVIETSDD